MIVASRPNERSARLLAVYAGGEIRDLPRAALARLFRPGDLVVANDAATLPASLNGVHHASGKAIEARLAAWIAVCDPTRFVAIAFGAGGYLTRTEDRAPPPRFTAGDRLSLGPLDAIIERLLDHPRALQIRFFGNRATVLAGLARHGRPIQYAHVPNPLALRDVWTRVAAEPIAFEPPSAGFAIEWRTLTAWREHGVHFATLTHAAGISSTGDRSLDRHLPFDEPYRIPTQTASAIGAAKASGGRVIAVGTTVVRALEAASNADGGVRAGDGVASGRILSVTPIRVVDAILTGVHQPGESHFELLRAFVDDTVLDDVTAASSERGYRGHEFGDSVLIERRPRGRERLR